MRPCKTQPSSRSSDTHFSGLCTSQALQHANTHVSLSPHVVAAAADLGVPLVKVGQGDLVLVQDVLARLAVNKVEGLAVGYHAGLEGCGGGDAVAGAGGRAGGVADDGHAGIGVGPEALAVGAGRRVELNQLGDGDAVLASDGVAGLALGHKVEGVAVGDDGGLDGGRGGDAVAGLRGGRGVADDGDAHVNVGPEAAAVLVDRGVPRKELVDGDAVLAQDGGAALARLDEVEEVAVADHLRLRGFRCGDAVAWLGRRRGDGGRRLGRGGGGGRLGGGGQSGGCGRGLGGSRGRGGCGCDGVAPTCPKFHAVRLADLQARAVGPDGGVHLAELINRDVVVLENVGACIGAGVVVPPDAVACCGGIVGIAWLRACQDGPGGHKANQEAAFHERRHYGSGIVGKFKREVVANVCKEESSAPCANPSSEIECFRSFCAPLQSRR